MTPKLRQLKAFVENNFSRRNYAFIGGVVLVRGLGEHVVATAAKDIGAFAAVVVNDPPYGTTNCPWDAVIPFEDYWPALDACCLARAPKVIFGSQPFTSALVMSNIKQFRYELIWDKNKCGSPGLAKIRPMKTHENILVFSKKARIYHPIMESGEAYSRKSVEREVLNNHGYGLKPQSIQNSGTRYPKSIRAVSRDFSAQQQLHPTQKPVPLLEWLLKTYAPNKGLAVDLSCGSGSLGVASINLDLPVFLVEKDPLYFKVARDWCRAIYSGKNWDPAAYRKRIIGL